MRIGYGFDIHPLQVGRPLFLGGVEIPHRGGLAGHSDGDVVIHAAIDALLGAAGLGDLGMHFPDTDPQWAGSSSLDLLSTVRNLLNDQGFRVGNLDLMLVAQGPMIASYRTEMVKRMADSLGTERARINLKATRPEGLGALGRAEGIACHAVALLEER